MVARVAGTSGRAPLSCEVVLHSGLWQLHLTPGCGAGALGAAGSRGLRVRGGGAVPGLSALSPATAIICVEGAGLGVRTHVCTPVRVCVV